MASDKTMQQGRVGLENLPSRAPSGRESAYGGSPGSLRRAVLDFLSEQRDNQERSMQWSEDGYPTSIVDGRPIADIATPNKDLKLPAPNPKPNQGLKLPGEAGDSEAAESIQESAPDEAADDSDLPEPGVYHSSAETDTWEYRLSPDGSLAARRPGGGWIPVPRESEAGMAILGQLRSPGVLLPGPRPQGKLKTDRAVGPDASKSSGIAPGVIGPRQGGVRPNGV